MPQRIARVLLDHFDHALRVAGEDHVGLGSDFDGVPSMPRRARRGEPAADADARTARARLARGVVRKVLGENLLRVLGAVETASRGEPS